MNSILKNIADFVVLITEMLVLNLCKSWQQSFLKDTLLIITSGRKVLVKHSRNSGEVQQASCSLSIRAQDSCFPQLAISRQNCLQSLLTTMSPLLFQTLLFTASFEILKVLNFKSQSCLSSFLKNRNLVIKEVLDRIIYWAQLPLKIVCNTLDKRATLVCQM